MGQTKQVDIEELKRLYLVERLTFKETARLLGVTPMTLRRRMRDLGLELNRPPLPGAVREDVSTAELRRLYVEEKLSTTEIARLKNISVSTVWRRLNAIGLSTSWPRGRA